MRAFIVRPFGTKEGIDFDRVQEDLVSPALREVGVAGATTGEIIKQGNIREDMFSLLLRADLVVADVSIHNANVFYELGIRHALRDRRSFLIKSRGDEVPFDLRTDRYFYYNADVPSDRLLDLVEALKATLNSLTRDSPVFQLLPALQPADPAVLNIVPFDFREEVDQAKARNGTGVLQLLAEEGKEFEWAIEGLRAVGQAQFDLGDNVGARSTWEYVRDDSPLDLEANANLATIYDRLGELGKSDTVLKRVLGHRDLPASVAAQFRALVGRNAKTRWQRDWQSVDEPENPTGTETKDEQRAAAVRSPHLEQSVEGYNEGFREDRNNCYSGLNALMQISILVELAEAMPAIWAERFEDAKDADHFLLERRRLRDELRVGVKLAVDSQVDRDRQSVSPWGWGLICRARQAHLTSSKPERVAHAYTEALARAPEWARSSSKQELEGFVALDIFSEKSHAAIAAIDRLFTDTSSDKPLDRIVLFAGHRIDKSDRENPRFPAKSEELARKMIREQLEKELKASKGRLLGVSGGANGGDILFQEACDELGVPSRLHLALPVVEYARAAVQSAGPNWLERFYRLCDREDNAPMVLSESNSLPRWLRDKRDYNVFQRSTHWMIHNAIAMTSRLTLIALWDGKEGDGPGGTHDIVLDMRQRGAKLVHLDACALAATDGCNVGAE